jgi:hypothetical protein
MSTISMPAGYRCRNSVLTRATLVEHPGDYKWLSYHANAQSSHDPIIESHQNNRENCSLTRIFESWFKGLVGASYELKTACRKLGYRRTPNLGAVRQLLT